jgi:hypothetical protein
MMHKKYQDMLKRISYKPNVRLGLSLESDIAILRITIKTPDSNNPEMDVLISHTDAIPLSTLLTMDFDRFVQWVHTRVRIMEIHEMGEFFRVDGRMIADPHANDKLRA